MMEQSALDPGGVLTPLRGLERRARRLAADALRRRAPLACVALGIGVDPKGAAESSAALPAAAAYAGQVLQASGRTSDCVGSLREGEFAVLAAATAPEGAERMAQPLCRGVASGG